MKVSELIEQLHQLPQDADVYITDNEYGEQETHRADYKRFKYWNGGTGKHSVEETRIGVVIE